jgi:transcriptional regulator with XRE-family HTH domain
MRRDQQTEYVEGRMRRSARFRRAYERYGRRAQLAILVCKMRATAGLSQTQLAERIGTSQPTIARLEDAEYKGHSLRILEKIAAACGFELKLRARKGAKVKLEIPLVA